MKNFDLHDIPKKMPYKEPEGLYEIIQENVLETLKPPHKPKAKIFKLDFSVVTSLAAALALIFGFTFLWKTNQASITKSAAEDTSIAKETTLIQTNPLAEPNFSLQDTGKQNSENATKNLTTSIANERANSNSRDQNYEQLLNALTEEELTELFTDTDHDIYLELYN